MVIKSTNSYLTMWYILLIETPDYCWILKQVWQLDLEDTCKQNVHNELKVAIVLAAK